MKFSDLAEKIRSNTVEPADLEGLSSDDVLKVRQEAGNGLVHSYLGSMGVQDALGSFGDGVVVPETFNMEGAKGVPYRMVSDDFIAPFGDRVMAGAWRFKEYKQRGSVVLYNHNREESRPPVGNGRDVKSKQKMTVGDKELLCVTGLVDFVAPSIYPFGGMVGRLAADGVMKGCSVGFDIVKSRKPTEEEVEAGYKFGVRNWSRVVQEANLIELSVTPLGRDRNAQRLSEEGLSDVERRLVEYRDSGVVDDELLGHLRDELARGADVSTRTSVVVLGLPSEAEAFIPMGEGAEIPVQLNGLPDGTTFNYTVQSRDANGIPNGITFQFEPAAEPEQEAEPEGDAASQSDDSLPTDERLARMEVQLASLTETVTAGFAQLRASEGDDEPSGNAEGTDEDGGEDYFGLLFDEADSSADDKQDPEPGDGAPRDLYEFAVQSGLDPAELIKQD